MKISKKTSLMIIVVVAVVYMIFMGYKVCMFNKNEDDENKYEELEELGVPKEVIRILPENLINSIRNNDSIIELTDYDISNDNDNELLGTLVFKHTPIYDPPYTEEEYHDLVLTFFKREQPKIPLIKDKINYTYNGEYSLVNSFVFIDGIDYLGRNVHVKEISRPGVKIAELVVYEGYLRTRFNNWQDIPKDIDYIVLYESSRNLISNID
jgi:hypothetical protein